MKKTEALPHGKASVFYGLEKKNNNPEL